VKREYRERPADVVTRRIDTAARGDVKPVDGSGSRALALLSISADDAKRVERLRQDARRAVARWSMRQSHDCMGKPCGIAAHGADRDVRDLLLEALGIGGEER
jgi:hypothetical protein